MNVPKGVRKEQAMYHLFGKAEGKKCKDCPHLIRKLYSRAYYKCEMYGDTCAESTDWGCTWTACGLIEGDHWRMYTISAQYGNVVNMLKHEPRGQAYAECDGQIRMEGL